MPKLETGMRTKRGFTLIEIMVVIIITATVITFALVSFGDFGKSRQARSYAQQLAYYITLLQQKAIIENRLFGIIIGQQSYQTRQYIPSKGWFPISKNGIYKEKPAPSGLRFITNTKNNAHESVDIIIQTSGDILPFRIYISDMNKHKIIRISSNNHGGVEVDTQI